MHKALYAGVGVAAVLAVCVGAWRVYAGDEGFSDEIRITMYESVGIDQPLTIYTPGRTLDDVMPLIAVSDIYQEFPSMEVLSADFSTGGTLETPGGVPQVVDPTEVVGGDVITIGTRGASHLAVMDLSLLDYTEQDVGGGVMGLVSDNVLRVIGVATSYEAPGETTTDVDERMLDVTVLDADLVDADGNGIPDATALLEPFTLMMGPNGRITYVVDLGELDRGDSHNGFIEFGLRADDDPVSIYVSAPTMNQLAEANAAYEMYAGRLIVRVASDPLDLVDLPDNADPAGEFDLSTAEPQGLFIHTAIALTDAVNVRGTIPQWTFLNSFPDDDLEIFLDIGGPGVAGQLTDGDAGFGYVYTTQTVQSGEDILIERASGWSEAPVFDITDGYDGDNEVRGGITVEEGDDALRFRSQSPSGMFASNLMPKISSGGGGGGSGHCFIATAAYGTPMAKEIQSLRDVRDTYLIDAALGSAFVDAYYRISPPIARLVSESPAAKTAVRAALAPVVTLSEWTMEAPGLVGMGALMVLLAGAMMSVRIRRRSI